MKANELMIGDFVLDGNDYAQVTSITCDGNIETTYNEHSNIELIEPIPLTQEILEKNGIKKDMHGRMVGEYFNEDAEGYLEISVNSKEIWWTINYDEYNIIQFKYVHELQHALRLCRIEKEIIL